jgi:hypothetical protein
LRDPHRQGAAIVGQIGLHEERHRMGKTIDDHGRRDLSPQALKALRRGQHLNEVES